MEGVISKLEGIPISLSVIKKACPKHTRVWLYDRLPSGSRQAVFGKYKNCIILYQMHSGGVATNQIGHYCLIMQTPGSKKLRYFSSFGLKPEQEIHLTHEGGRLLQILGRDYEYNRVAVQSTRNTNTCGLHALARAYLYKMENADYLKLIKRYNAKNSDDLVSIMTLVLVIKELEQ